MVPAASPIAILINPTNPEAEDELKDIQDTARSLGLQILVVSASKADDLNGAFETLVQQQARALIVGGDTFFTGQRAIFPFSPLAMACQPSGIHASRPRQAA